MLINFLYFIIKCFCKISGLSISFSNDGEDLILIKYLAKINDGNYIDIGSHQPVKGSNTFLFYLLKWQGICIDPLPSLRNKYKFFRSRDKFINAGVIGSNSKNKKELKYYYYKYNTDNSTLDPNRVKELSTKFGREPSSIISIPKITISEMLHADKKFKSINKEIHLLSLDIQGFEFDILNDFFTCNIFPWIICVEEIGKTADTLKNGKIYSLMKNNNYMLGSRTFLSSIYVLKNKIDQLLSPYIKELQL